MDITPEDIIDEFNEAITNPQKYREIIIKKINPNCRSAILLKTQKPKQPVEIDYLLLKMSDEVLKEINKNNSNSSALNKDFSSIYRKYGKINISMTYLNTLNSNLDIQYIICELLNEHYDFIFSDKYDSLTVACSKDKRKDVLFLFYNNFIPFENDNINNGTNNSSNIHIQNSTNIFGNNNFPFQEMQNIIGQFNIGNIFNRNINLNGQQINMQNTNIVNNNITFNNNHINNNNYHNNTNFESNKNDNKKNEISESKLFFYEEIFKEMEELKEKINKYKEFDEKEAQKLINKIDEKIKKHDYELQSIKECKKIIKDVNQWIDDMKMKEYAKLKNDKEKMEKDLKRATNEKKEMENNYRILLEKRNKKK